MKKILLLLLFITGTLYAQPPIAQPNDLIVCDDNGDGFEAFDLTVNEIQTLNGLNPSLYDVKYFSTLTDAQNNTAAFVNEFSYYNSTNPQTIYVRVEENANPTNYATTSFNLIVNPLPDVLQPNDMLVYESPFDGSATFDLTQTIDEITNSTANLNFGFYGSLNDAQFGANAYTNPSAYNNISNPETVYVRVEDAISGCYSITNFDLIVALDDIVFIPDTNFKAKLLAADITNNIASNVNPNSSATPNVFSKVDTNQDGEIQYSEAQAIVYMNVDGTSTVNGGIQNLQGLEAFVNLDLLRCNYNQLATVDLSICPSIKYFYSSNSGITTLGLNNCANLEILNCGYNQLTAIDLSQCPNLTNLVIRNNQLASLNVNTNQQLQSISAFYNNIATFQVQDKNLRTLEIGFNQLTDLQLTNLPFLYRIKAQNNNLTSVDLSTVAFQYEPNNLPQANILDLDFNNNVNLTYLNIKNGYTNFNNSLSSDNVDDTQLYICVDDNDIYQYFFTTSNPIVNTYCSFNPGGNFNTISGITQFDVNNNGCDANDIPVQYFEFGVSLNGVSTNSSLFTNSLGNYALFASQTGTYELTPNLENPTYFSVSPNPTNVTVATIDNSTTTQNFCLSANGVHPDLEIVIAPITPARPGFDAVYKIVYKNKGNQTVDGFVNFTYNDALLDLVSSSVTPTNAGNGSMNWFVPGLVPFQSGSITITLNVNSPQEIPAVNIGDVLAFNAFIDVTTDDNWNDNNFNFNQTVVGSYDPNDITCIEGNVVAPSYIGQYLHYVINFENTGTYQAENIVVKTTINPADFDINTLRLLEASHNVTTRINGDIVEFIFQTINLDTGGHGNVLLKIRTKDELTTSDMVSKKADIYFDYNFPIETNFANTTFQVLSNSIVTIDNSVGIYPNPANDIVNIKANGIISSVEIYDIQGRIIQKKIMNVKNETIDVSSLTNGIYFMMIKTQMGQKVERLVKE